MDNHQAVHVCNIYISFVASFIPPVLNYLQHGNALIFFSILGSVCDQYFWGDGSNISNLSTNPFY